MKKLDKFLEIYYEKELLMLVDDVKQKIYDEEDELVLYLQAEFGKIFENIGRIQEETLPFKVKFINISFLLTSLYEKEIKLKVEAYTRAGNLMSDSIMSGKIELKGLKNIIDNTKQKLLRYVDDNMYSSFIHESHIDTIILRMTLSLHMYLAEYYKYFAKEVFDIKELKYIDQDEELFITYGEYFDWQKAVYGKRKQIDIFNRSEEDDLRFRQFKTYIYQDKEFNKLTIKNCDFENCKFIDSIITRTSFIDCTFTNCIFENVNLEDSKLIGVTFDNCRLYSVSFKDTISYINTMMDENNFHIYKELEFIDTSLTKCKFENCNLENSTLIETEIIECKFINTNTMFSDFDIFNLEVK